MPSAPPVVPMGWNMNLLLCVASVSSHRILGTPPVPSSWAITLPPLELICSRLGDGDPSHGPSVSPVL